MDVKWRWKGWWRFTAVVFGNAKSRAVGRNAGKATPRKRIQMTFHPSARNHTQICSEGGAQVNPWSAQARPQVLIGRSRIPHEAGCSHRRIMVDVLGRIDGWWKRSSTEM